MVQNVLKREYGILQRFAIGYTITNQRVLDCFLHTSFVSKVTYETMEQAYKKL